MSKEIEFDISELEENPILKPLSEYHSESQIYEDVTKKEAEYLKRVKEEIDGLLKTDIYENSTIARTYKSVVEILERLLWAATTNVELGEKKIEEIKKIVDKYYIPIKNHKKKIEKYENEIKNINEKIIELENKKEIEFEIKNNLDVEEIENINSEEKDKNKDKEIDFMDNTNPLEEESEDEDENYIEEKINEKRPRGRPKKNGTLQNK